MKNLIPQDWTQFIHYAGKHPSFEEAGKQMVLHFPNGFGASVIQSPGSYGNERGLYELAVIQFDSAASWQITYDTPITADVLGNLTPKNVIQALLEIKALPNTAKQQKLK